MGTDTANSFIYFLLFFQPYINGVDIVSGLERSNFVL